MNEISYNLIRAVREGRLKTVQDLVNQYGLSYAEEWADGYVLLCNSIELNLTEISKFLINSGAKVNSEKSETIKSNTPLHFAVRNRDKEILEMLLKRGANINAKDSEYRTPLFLATMQGNEETVEILLNSGANVCGDKRGTTPLHLASIRGSFNIAEKLLKHGSYVNSTCNFYNSSKGFTPLHYAVENNKEAIVLLHLSHGANVDAGSQNMTTPLHIATRKGYVTIVELLLRSGACVNAKTKEGLTPLHFASEKGNIELMKILLKNKADIDPSANNKMTPLCMALNGSHEVAAKFLLIHKAKVDAEDENGKSVLCFGVETGSKIIVKTILNRFPDKNNASNKNAFKIAAKCWEKNYVTIVDYLLKYGFSVEREDINDSALMGNCARMGYIKILKGFLNRGIDLSVYKDLNTLFHIAVENRQTEVAKFLLNNGADVNAIDKAGNSPILYSTENCDVITTEVLLSHGANIQNSPELLIIATKMACKEMVEVLLQNQADIEANDQFGRTALHLTALNEYDSYLFTYEKYNPDFKAKEEIFKLLLRNGANVNAKIDNDGFTALHIACQRGFSSFVEVLLEYKADVNCIAQDFTPLHIAAQNGQAQIVEMLLANGANVNAKTPKDGLTALHIACQKSFTNVIEVLLKYKADVNCFIKDLTPLHVAAQNGEMQIVEMLLANGANINARRENGETSLHIAAKNGHLDVMNILLNYKADIECEDINGGTPLHSAAAQDKYETVSLLLEHGAFIDAQNKEGKTALHIASQLGMSRVVNLLLRLGSDINILTNNNCTPTDLTNRPYYLKTRRPTFLCNSEFDHVNQILEMHLILLKTANLYINEKYSRFLNSVPDTVAHYNEEYKEEIERMKKEKLGRKNVSWYDMLSTNSYSMAKYAKNQDIRQIMDSYKVSFPNFACLIDRNFKRGVERNRLLEVGQEFFIRYFKLPYQCSDEILSYLSDDDLKTIKKI